MLEIKNTMNFRSQKLALIHTQCIESFNSDHSRTTFPLATSIQDMYYDLIVSTLKKRENHILCFDWKYVSALVGNSCTYRLDMHPWLVMGGSTIKVKEWESLNKF